MTRGHDFTPCTRPHSHTFSKLLGLLSPPALYPQSAANVCGDVFQDDTARVEYSNRTSSSPESFGEMAMGVVAFV